MKTERRSINLQAGQQLSVRIERLASGGRGVARHEGLVFFVPLTAPGDLALVEITSLKKSFAEAKLIEVKESGASRIVPPCPVYGNCGGCNIQHVAYDEQLIQKRGFVRDALRKFSGFDVSDEGSVLPTVPSPKPFRYRNRIQLHLRAGRIGFHGRGTNQIVDIDDCPITEEKLAREIPSLRSAASDQQRVEIYLTEKNEVERRSGAGFDEESLAFSQVNTAQNENLVQAIVAVAEQMKPKVIYDLYSGNGNFTFPLANANPGAEIRSCEMNSLSVEIARKRSERHFPGRKMKIDRGDVATYVEKETFTSPEGTLLILDPPRAGCGIEVLRTIAKKGVATIAYVSCDPVTMARDLKGLHEAGYKLISAQPFDMFPQTDHVETLMVLKI